jgi:hypothetical protein
MILPSRFIDFNVFQRATQEATHSEQRFVPLQSWFLSHWWGLSAES